MISITNKKVDNDQQNPIPTPQAAPEQSPPPAPTIDLGQVEQHPISPNPQVQSAPTAPPQPAAQPLAQQSAPEPVAAESQPSAMAGNKGLLIAIVVGAIIAIVGAIALFSGGGSATEYQGLIRQVEQQAAQ